MEDQIASMGIELGSLAAKGTATAVANRFKAIREKSSKEDICNSYEEVINELVAERGRAIAIARAYESELERFRITDEDIEYLQNTVGTVLDLLKDFVPEAQLESVEQFKALVSVDALKSMQLIGFDFKAAIGDPLTRACASAIERNLAPKTSEGGARHRGKRS